MILCILLLILVIALISFALKLTGTVLSTVLWFCIKIPFAIIACIVGIACCCTIILIPIGILSFKAGMRMAFPLCA